jgi:hypothetical protein
MTGRIRSIKPEWIDSELFCSASDASIRLAFVLLSLVDDDGRVRISMRALGLRAWGFCDSVADKATHARMAMDGLIHVGWVVEYEADGIACWQIRNFAKHQRIDKYKASKLPPPPERSREVATSRDESRMVAPDQDQGSGGGSGSGAGDVARAPDPQPVVIAEPPKAPTAAEHAPTDRMLRSFDSERHPEIIALVSETRQAAGGAPFVCRSHTDRDSVSRLAEWAARPEIGVTAAGVALRAFYAAKGTAARLSWLVEEDPGRYLGKTVAKVRKGEHRPALPNDCYSTDLTDLDQLLGGGQ